MGRSKRPYLEFLVKTAAEKDYGKKYRGLFFVCNIILA